MDLIMETDNLDSVRRNIKDFLNRQGREVKNRARSDRVFCGSVFYECSVHLAKNGFKDLKLEEFQRLFHEQVFV